MRAGESTCLAGANDGAATRHDRRGVGRRGEVAQLMTRKQTLEGDTQVRMTGAKRGLQRATSISELLRC